MTGVLAMLVVSPQPIPRSSERAAMVPQVLTKEIDARLQKDLEHLVRRERLWPAVEEGKLALLLAVVSDPEQPRLAELNGHKMMYAASLPKIAILLGGAVAVQQQHLKLDRKLRADMVNMIRYSCNDCATRVLERVGREFLIELLQAPEYRFYDPDDGGGLWVGKDYAPRPAYHRDPVNNLSHGATAFQVARFYYMLATGTLVDRKSTSLMWEALSKPGISHKFVRSLGAIPGLEMLRKSGTWREYHSDSALVRYHGETYIIVGLTRDKDGGKWLAQLARPIHELAMNQAGDRRYVADL